jgi:voltage-gated potassium channel
MAELALEHRASKSKWWRARHYTYELLHTPEIETKVEHYVRVSIGVLIALSLVSVILESEQAIEAAIGDYLYAFEVFVIVAFSVEYVLRLWSIVHHPKYRHWFFGRLRYAVTPLALVDLVAVLPFYLPAVTTLDLRFIRTLRLVRLARVLKLGHYSKSLTLISRVVKHKRHEMGAALFLVFLLLVIASTLMYHIEHEVQPEVFSSIPKSLWWGVATLTTIGYGDIVPITAAGRTLAAIISVLGIGVFALPSGILVSGFIEEVQQKHDVIICSRCKEEIAVKETWKVDEKQQVLHKSNS